MRSNFKKFLAITLILALAFSLAACGRNSKGDNKKNPSESQTQEVTEQASSVETEESTKTEEPTTEPASEESSETPEPQTEEPTEPDDDGYTKVDETVYASDSVNVRSEPNTDCDIVGGLGAGESIHRIAIGNDGWSKVEYDGQVRYIKSEYLRRSSESENSDEPAPAEEVEYPINYSDDTCSITITREWYENAWCYIAHLTFSDYTRFGTDCANGAYNHGTETTSAAASRLGAILCVNGDYSAPNLDYPVARGGKIWNDKPCYAPGSYNRNNGIFYWTGEGSSTQGTMLSEMVSQGLISDTMTFGPAFLVDGEIKAKAGGSQAQRTFIGTNGNAGDIYVVVSDGRYNDGESSGLTGYQCARLLADKGCTFGIPLDGGGSSTMVYNGTVLNAAKGNERAIVDFIYFK